MKTGNIQQKKPPDAWEWIKFRLASKGYTFGKLALIHGVKKTNFTNVKRVHVPKYQAIIADYLGVSPQSLWPSRYTAEGDPISRYGKHKNLKKSMEKLSKKTKMKKIPRRGR